MLSANIFLISLHRKTLKKEALKSYVKTERRFCEHIKGTKKTRWLKVKHRKRQLILVNEVLKSYFYLIFSLKEKREKKEKIFLKKPSKKKHKYLQITLDIYGI